MSSEDNAAEEVKKKKASLKLKLQKHLKKRFSVVHQESGKHKVQDETRKILPQIQQFLQALLGMEWEKEIRNSVTYDVMEIMKDILSAYENDDEVLLIDATAYGVQEYLKYFVSEELLNGNKDEKL